MLHIRPALNGCPTSGEAAEQSPASSFSPGRPKGVLLAEYASAHGIGCFVSVATEYGKCLLGDLEHVTVLAGRMDEKQIEAFYRRKPESGWS